MLTWKRNARLGSNVRMVGLLGLLNLFPLAAPATAGQGAANPAGIVGQVTDGTGAVLPGVTVTATSPALQVPQVVTLTDERGEYRLTPLPIGLYTVTFELAGFQNLRREGVRLPVGFVARIDQVLNLGSVSESITVSGASPLVDVASTSTTTELTREALDVLPTTRDGLKAFMGQVPGARSNLDVGSGGMGDGIQFRIYGQSGEPWQMLEGIFGSSPTSSGSSAYHVDFSSIEGARVQTVGSNAEMPRRGLMVDAIVKSGGNDFHGDAVMYGSSGRFEGSNVDETLRAAGVTGVQKLHTLTDFSGNVGGRLVRNKLWFFVGVRDARYDRELLNAFHDDGSPVLQHTAITYQVEKLSYQMTPGNRFTGFFHRTLDGGVRGADRFTPVESMEEARAPVEQGKVEWQGLRGSSLVTSLQSGFWYWHSNKGAVPEGRDKVATRDIATQFVTGARDSDRQTNDKFRHHTKGVMSWYRSDLLAGNHEFKGGFDHLFSRSNTVWDSRRSGNYQLLFNNGAPFQINTWNYPVDPQNNGNYLGLYAQDAWTIARRLTLNLGLRWARDNAYAPQQCREAADFAAAECWDKIQMNIWNSFAPRLHAAFDLFGNGKTVLKGGWGRFDHLREIDPELTAINRNNAMTTLWNWRDLNGNRNYDPGEVNLDPNGPDFQSIAGVTDAVPNPNEKQPKNNEFSLTLERELMANWAVRVTGVYARNFNVYRLAETKRPFEVYNIPITNPDPGRDGRVGTADDPGTFVTYYDYPASLAGRQFAGTMLINDPNADSNFKTIEVASTRRLSEGWQLMMSYTATRSDIPVPPRSAFNPNTEIFAADRTWEWQYKMSGAYTFPYQIIASANFEHRSGAPQARQVLLTGGRQIRSIVVNVEPIGSLRLPSINMLDVRGGKRFPLGAGRRSLEFRADVFNMLNINNVLSRNLRSGSSFLATAGAGQSASAIVTPRILQIGATFSF